MKQSTSFAQVATNLLNVLQGYSKGIRLLLVMFLTLNVTTNAWGATYTKVTSSPADWSGEYIVVYESDNTAYVWTGVDAAKCNTTATISNNSVTGDFVTVTIAPMTDGYSIKVNSGTNSGKYIYGTSGSNKLNFSASAQLNTLSYETDWVKITSNTSVLTFNKTSSDMRFRYYRSSSYSSQQHIQLYKLSTGGSVTPDPCTTPIVAWNTKPANGEVGGSMTASVTTNYSNGLTYSSSNQTVATVTNAGVINYLSAGTTTITATVTGDGTTICEGPVSVQQEITVTAPASGGGGEGECSWVETAISSIKSTDIVVITMTTSGGTTYAMSNNNGTSAPTATSVTVSGSTLTGDIADNLKWNITNNAGSLTIYPNGTTSTWLYCTNTNNGVKVGNTGDGKAFTIDATSGYLKNTYTSRYVGVYTTNPDWRCYTSTTTNIANQTLKFYVYQCSDDGGDDPEPEPDPVDPEVTFSDGEYTVGGAALDLSTLLTTNSTGAVTYSVIADGGTGAIIEGSTFTATAAGTCTVQALIAATATHKVATATATISVTAAPCNNKVTIEKGTESNGTFSLDKSGEQETCDGLTITVKNITPSIGYRFKEITQTGVSTGVTLDQTNKTVTYAENTTGTSTINVVFEKIPTQTVTWKVGEVDYATSEVESGTKIATVPDNPANTAIGNCANAFIGWSETNIGSTPDDANLPTIYTSLSEIQTAYPSITADKTFYAVFATAEGDGSTEGWTLTSNGLSDLTTNDVFVFAVSADGTYYAMPNDEGTSSSPNLTAITVKDSKITSEVLDKLKWNISGNATNGYIFYPNGSTTTWLYCNTTASSSSNDNIRVGTGSRKAWKQNSSTKYLYNDDNDYKARYLSRNGTTDFRSYVNTDNKPIVPKVFKYNAGTTYSNYVTNCCNTLAPKNGTYTSVSGTEIKLTWEDAANTNRYHITGGNLSAEGVYSTNKYYNVTGLTECEEYTFYVSAYPTDGCESATIAIPVKPYIPKVVTFDDGTTTTTQTTSCASKTVIVPTPTAQNCSTYVWKDEATGTDYAAGQTITPANDMTIVAKWSVITYTITFNDWDGTQLQQSIVECGQTPAYNGETPTRPEDNTYKYTFAGWNPSIEEADGNQTYTATYDKEAHPITIIWMVNGEEYTLGDPSTMVSAGEKVAKLPTPPNPDDYCGQVFAGWTDQPINGAPIADAPAVLFNTPEASPTLYKEGDKTTVTFYAVFADIKE